MTQSINTWQTILYISIILSWAIIGYAYISYTDNRQMGISRIPNTQTSN